LLAQDYRNGAGHQSGAQMEHSAEELLSLSTTSSITLDVHRIVRPQSSTTQTIDTDFRHRQNSLGEHTGHDITVGIDMVATITCISLCISSLIGEHSDF
jgi:hypothetical protein